MSLWHSFKGDATRENDFKIKTGPNISATSRVTRTFHATAVPLMSNLAYKTQTPIWIGGLDEIKLSRDIRTAKFLK